jgi:hypothetical protein
MVLPSVGLFVFSSARLFYSAARICQTRTRLNSVGLASSITPAVICGYAVVTTSGTSTSYGSAQMPRSTSTLGTSGGCKTTMSGTLPA